jgi:hypothetical protein
MARQLTTGELEILEMIQEAYGPQNTADNVFFSERDEAVIFVKTATGTTPLMVVLTNLAKVAANRAKLIMTNN